MQPRSSLVPLDHQGPAHSGYRGQACKVSTTCGMWRALTHVWHVICHTYASGLQKPHAYSNPCTCAHARAACMHASPSCLQLTRLDGTTPPHTRVCPRNAAHAEPRRCRTQYECAVCPHEDAGPPSAPPAPVAAQPRAAAASPASPPGSRLLERAWRDLAGRALRGVRQTTMQQDGWWEPYDGHQRDRDRRRLEVQQA